MLFVASGHRPPTCGGYNETTYNNLRRVAQRSLEVHNPERVIVGMAQGWDQAVALACTDLGIPFEAYVPFPGQETVWPRRSQTTYQKLIEKADLVVMLKDREPNDKQEAGEWLLERNLAMLELLKQDPTNGMLLALWNGDQKGGTAHMMRNLITDPACKGIRYLNCWMALQTLIISQGKIVGY